MGERAPTRAPTLWETWRPGRRAEALLIALALVGLALLTMAVGYRFYTAGLVAVSRLGGTPAWLLQPGEAGLALVLGVAVGGWLAGVWLGERLRRDWLPLTAVTAVTALPLLHLFHSAVVAPAPLARFGAAGLAAGDLWLAGPALLTLTLLLGGAVGSWWARLGPE